VSGTGFNGQIAEVAVWNTTLTEPQIRALAQGASPLDFALSNLYYYGAFQIGLRPRLHRVPIVYTFVGPVSIHGRQHPRLPGLVQSKRDYFMPAYYRAALVSGPATLAASGTVAPPSMVQEGFGTRAVTLDPGIKLPHLDEMLWKDANEALFFGNRPISPRYSIPPLPLASRDVVQDDDGSYQGVDGTVTLTLPTGLLPGTSLRLVIKTGGASCTFVPGVGASILSKNSYTKLNTLGAEAQVVYTGNGLWVLTSGDLVAA
jgi:hypothetical protein